MYLRLRRFPLECERHLEKAGFNVAEKIITATSVNKDLYDNAAGFSNYTAPGADRFKISVSLVKKEITDFSKRLKDRFGSIPNEITNLFNAVRLRWIAKKLGFERIILKNNKMHTYLPKKENQIYYKSNTFSNILKFNTNILIKS